MPTRHERIATRSRDSFRKLDLGASVRTLCSHTSPIPNVPTPPKPHNDTPVARTAHGIVTGLESRAYVTSPVLARARQPPTCVGSCATRGAHKGGACGSLRAFLSGRAAKPLHRSPATAVRRLRSILFGSWAGVAAEYAPGDAGQPREGAARTHNEQRAPNQFSAHVLKTPVRRR